MNFQDNSILINSVYFGIVFCVAGIFFLASSVIFNRLSEFEKNYQKKHSTSKILSEIFSLILGLTVSLLLMPILNYFSLKDNNFSKLIFIVFYLMICSLITKFSVNPIQKYLSSRMSNIEVFYANNEAPDTSEQKGNKFLIDTNIFIDGRILNLAENNIITADLIVPNFVIEELQFIADSPNDLLRKKGKRGLNILNGLKNMDHINLQIIETNKNGKDNVDSLLLQLALQFNAGIISNDSNLCKIANAKNIPTININKIAISLKPELLQGEKILVTPIKKGKVRDQAIAYLEDGTMIVIDNAEEHIGTEIQVEITESIQSSQGKMIFSKIIEDF